MTIYDIRFLQPVNLRALTTTAPSAASSSAAPVFSTPASPNIVRYEAATTYITPPSNPFNLPTVKIGVILAGRRIYPWALNRTRPAIERAAELVTSPNGSLPGYPMLINFRDSQCSETHGALQGIDLYVKKMVNVFIGPSCDYSIAPLARLVSYWGPGGIPILTAGALVEAFGDKEVDYRQLTRVQGSHSKSAEFLDSILAYLEWSHVGFVFHDFKFDGKSSRSDCSFTVEAMFLNAKSRMGRQPWHVSFDQFRATEKTITSVVAEIEKHCRTSHLCITVLPTIQLQTSDAQSPDDL
ncbi:Atrial natriuretic peptide receptor [Plakobranchus ocellatus]|uniref:Atrial natriuretic peptide receptor n=1 Tax=Plakobranchus ocellatus TaxID=259542 RepID=A0AAV3Z2V1_9GAST|nr:Atrial natriuretic peptide receptor [Plakobranchus ocellatus]